MSKILTGIALFTGLVACAGPLSQSSFEAEELQRATHFVHQNLTDLKIGVLPATGANGYRRVLADSFSKALRQIRPEVLQLPPQEVLSTLNRVDLSDEYTNMLKDYETSGILRKASLNRIGKGLGVQYLIHLSLLQYVQNASTRVSVLGIRFIQTRSSTLRVFAQIWDTASGEIVWEGSSSVTLAGEDVREKPIPFEDVATRAWKELIQQLP